MLVLAVCGLLPLAARAAGPSAYVANTLGETLSRIDLTSGQVDHNIVVLGSDVNSAPNQVIVRDTMAYVINSTTDELQCINLLTETTVGYVTFPSGSNPYAMAFYDDRYAYVTLLWNNSLAKVDVDTRQIVREDSIGISPGGLVIHDHKAYVGITAVSDEYVYGQGKLAIWDCRADTLITCYNVGTNPNSLAVDGGGDIHVLCTGDYFSDFGISYIISGAADVVSDSLPLGGSPGSIAIGPDNYAYCAAGGWVSVGNVFVYNAGTREILYDSSRPLLVTKGCMAVAPFQDSTVMAIGFYDTVQVVNVHGGGSIKYAVGDGPVFADYNYRPGDITGDWMVDIGDLTRLIEYLFITFEPMPYPGWQGNVDGDFSIDVGDLTRVIEYLFLEGAGLRVGPTWLRFD